jgi:hypothetical protein
MFQAGLGAASSSSSVKSVAARAARKMVPVSNWERLPFPGWPLAALPGVRHVEFW